jgi:hypothetical protein
MSNEDNKKERLDLWISRECCKLSKISHCLYSCVVATKASFFTEHLSYCCATASGDGVVSEIVQGQFILRIMQNQLFKDRHKKDYAK